jgi:hypothetical protein
MSYAEIERERWRLVREMVEMLARLARSRSLLNVEQRFAVAEKLRNSATVRRDPHFSCRHLHF